MKKKQLFTFAFLFINSISILSQNNYQLDSILTILDKTIKTRNQYSQKKQSYITNLEQQLNKSIDNSQRFELLGELFNNYQSFQLDSAFCIALRRMEIAQQQKDSKHIFTANINFAESKMKAGLYNEALDIVMKQNKNLFGKQEQAHYYHICHSLYIFMANHSISEKEKKEYKQLEYQYKDSILSLLSPNELGYPLVKTSKLLEDGKYSEALDVAKECFYKFNKQEHDIALTSYMLAQVYNRLGDSKQEKKYLALSAIHDMKAGVREYIALRELAQIEYKESNINRAYLYMKCAMEDAIACRAKLRTLEVSQMLPIINASYDQKMKDEKERLIGLLVIISILSLVLVLSIVYIYKQLKTLAQFRKSLSETNAHLYKVNEELNKVNADLSEANIIKEEYISYVFNICSSYIDKLDDFRKKVNRKIKAGQIKELDKMTDSSSFVSDELKEFYKNFDTIFLNLYPTFISDFNSLLFDDEQILPKEGELLNSELRIYALIRLGIEDSVKIASFLHYSPQTVYNYRLRIRNKAKISKIDFHESIRQLGHMKN